MPLAGCLASVLSNRFVVVVVELSESHYRIDRQ